MATENPILQAQQVIGFGQKEDYVLKPTKHAEEFQSTAPDLAAILRASDLSVTIDQYEEKDATAVEAQNEFRKVFNRANVLVLITAVFSALILTTGVLSAIIPDGLEKTLLIAFSIGSVVTGALAAKDLFSIRQGRLLEAWMKARASAESKRLEFFTEVAKADTSTAVNAIPVDLLKLEYFRRFQLDVQRAYFTRRAGDHGRDAKRILSYSGASIAGAAVVTGLAGALTILNAHFAAIASLGAVFTALSSYASLREQIYQSQRLSDRYGQTGDALQDLYKRLDSVRKAVQANGPEPMLGYIDAVHEVLLAEHKQWLGEQDEKSSTMVKLDELLQQASKQPSNQQEAGKETAEVSEV
ncbi:MAG TPA: hypothetical protein VM871_00345 [Flavisolibacter sp.]|nr:hypothetical protein [Flavisolibacter sp.]